MITDAYLTSSRELHLDCQPACLYACAKPNHMLHAVPVRSVVGPHIPRHRVSKRCQEGAEQRLWRASHAGTAS